MKNLKKLLAMCLSVIMIFSCIPAAFAADVANATIDEAAKGSLTLYKYEYCDSCFLLVPICMENLFPALHFQSVCVPCFEVGLL